MAPIMLDEIPPILSDKLTLEDVLADLEMVGGLAKKRRDDLRSAVTSVARLMGRSHGDIVVDIPHLRAFLASVHPVPARMSQKRLMNIKSDFRRALELVGAIPPALANTPLSENWQTFLALGKKPHQAPFLTRLATYCCATGRAWEDVDDALMAEFHAYLNARLITSDPDNICRQSRYKFNAILQHNGLARPLLTTRRNLRRNLPLSAYPAPFQDDFARLVATRQQKDIWAEDTVEKPQSPITIRNLEARVRQTLSAAVSAGMAPEDFQSLADLANVETVKAALTHRRRERDGQLRPSDFEIVYTLSGIAKHHVKADPAELQQFKSITHRVGKATGSLDRTMGERSRRQLDQFLYDPENVARLLLLPKHLMARIHNQPFRRQTALEAMRAAAIGILLSYPIRVKNLSLLQIGKHLSSLDIKGNPRFKIHVEPSEVKNEVTLEAILSRGTSQIVNMYIKNFRKLVAPGPSSVLFPTSSGGTRNPGDFGTSLSKTVKDATGLYVTPHGFRHFAGFLYLSAHPGDYVTVQKLLGHKKIDTTIRFYAPLSSLAAVERYADLLDTNWGPKK